MSGTKPYNPDDHPYAKAFEDMGYTIDDSFPWCVDHCSQMMLNSQGQLECVVCTGNEIAFVVVEK